MALGDKFSRGENNSSDNGRNHNATTRNYRNTPTTEIGAAVEMERLITTPDAPRERGDSNIQASVLIAIVFADS